MALEAIKNELRVAFSRNAQLLWFRVTKWVIFIAVSKRLRGSRWLRVWTFGGVFAGLTGHLVYRWKPRGWTGPFGVWADI